MLILSRKTGEIINIGDEISLAVLEVSGDKVKIGIIAPKDIKVYRKEIFDEIKEENLAASVTKRVNKLDKVVDLIKKNISS